MSQRPAPKTALACLGLVAATLLAYGRVLGHGFVAYDTPLYLTGTPIVLRGLSWEGVRWAFTQAHASNWHPLTWLSHLLDVEVLGLRPGLHAFENVLWHAANACLVLLAFLRLTGAFGKSLFVAALFALHPLHVESVAWASERKDVLSTFFGFAALLVWVGWTERGGSSRYLVALLAYAQGTFARRAARGRFERPCTAPPADCASTVATAESAASARNGTFSRRSFGIPTSRLPSGPRSRRRSTKGQVTSIGFARRPSAKKRSAQRRAPRATS